MKLEDYENLPDSMSRVEIQRYCLHALRESETESIAETLAKLEELSQRQWHTYELPDPALQRMLRQWLIDRWVSPDQAYLESVLGLSYCFALDKAIFIQALESYCGEHHQEFEQALETSQGDRLDPWASLRELPVKPKET